MNNTCDSQELPIDRPGPSTAMRKEVVDINGVPTYVATWGAWIKDDLGRHENLIVCIPGNPGVTGFYEEFLQTLYDSVKMPVWIMSHAGHEVGRNITIPPLSENQHLYSLEGQINHKIEFIRRYVPSHLNIYIIGHSIGSFITLQILKQCPDINENVKKAYLLFPAIQKLKDTPNGKMWRNILLPAVPFLLFLSMVFIFLPIFLRKIILFCYFRIRPGKNAVIRPTLKLLNPRALKNVFFIAQDNLENVNELDGDLIDSLAHKLVFFYGTKDRWAPLKYYEELSKTHPTVKVITTNIQHAFVLTSAPDVASHVSQWITSDGSSTTLSHAHSSSFSVNTVQKNEVDTHQKISLP